MKNLFKLPSPKELGWSNCNCLGLEMTRQNKEEKTWEDYDREMKKLYPIRFWFNKTLPLWFSVHIKMFFEDLWIKTKLKWTKDHLVDLRKSGYQFGLMPQQYPTSKLLQANMAVLIDYIEKYKPINPKTWAKLEVINQCQELQERIKQIDNLYMIYYYWKDFRPRILNSLPEEEIDQKDTEMLKLLIEARNFMIEVKGYG